MSPKEREIVGKRRKLSKYFSTFNGTFFLLKKTKQNLKPIPHFHFAPGSRNYLTGPSFTPHMNKSPSGSSIIFLKLFFFLCRPFLVFIKFVTILLLFYVLIFFGYKACRILAPRPGIQ